MQFFKTLVEIVDFRLAMTRPEVSAIRPPLRSSALQNESPEAKRKDVIRCTDRRWPRGHLVSSEGVEDARSRERQAETDEGSLW